MLNRSLGITLKSRFCHFKCLAQERERFAKYYNFYNSGFSRVWKTLKSQEIKFEIREYLKKSGNFLLVIEFFALVVFSPLFSICTTNHFLRLLKTAERNVGKSDQGIFRNLAYKISQGSFSKTFLRIL